MPFSAMKNRPVNRHRLLSKATKMFCTECRVIRTVKDFFAPETAALDCGHRRTIELKERTEVVA
jgi:hypothetical protein